MGEDLTLPADLESGAAKRAYARALGARLRIVRSQMGQSLHEVEAISSGVIKASVLGAYERGERMISVPRLCQLAGIYDLPVEQLLPPQESSPPYGTSRPSTISVLHQQKVSFDLSKVRAMGAAEHDLLRPFLATIQVQRQDFNGRMITIRDTDVRVIASCFGLTCDTMKQRLVELDVLVDA
jgi:transcriptional regulator with XRE-family HTH domain